MGVHTWERAALFSSLSVKEKEAVTYTLAGVSVADSISFEKAAEMATEIDYPEEIPEIGDEMCAFVRNDTIFVQYWHDIPEQRGLFRFKFGE
jgi:hypothetical protein